MKTMRLGGMLLLGLTLAACQRAAPEANTATGDAAPIEAATPTPTPTPSPSASPSDAGSSDADMIITGSLLADPPSYEELGDKPTQTSICLGDPLKIANISSKTVGLIDTPAESDASAEIGIVRADGVLTITPQETGVFLISEADKGDPLFRYEVKKCR